MFVFVQHDLKIMVLKNYLFLLGPQQSKVHKHPVHPIVHLSSQIDAISIEELDLLFVLAYILCFRRR